MVRHGRYTDRQTDEGHQRLMPPPYGAGHSDVFNFSVTPINPSCSLTRWYGWGALNASVCGACRLLQVIIIIMPPPLMGGGIKRCFCLTSVAHIGPNSRTDRPRIRKTKIGTDDHFQGQKVKVMHQAALVGCSSHYFIWTTS